MISISSLVNMENGTIFNMFSAAFKTSLPALVCYIPLGIVYGVLCTQAGHPWYYAPLFCACVLAGAMQFLALTLLAAGASLLTIAIAIIPLGIRNIFYGLTMLDRFRPLSPWLRLYLAHGLVDATYSLLNTGGPTYEEREDVRYMTWLTVLIHFYWVLGGLLGSSIIHLVPLPPGLEFSLTAFFAAVAVDQFLKKKEIKALWIAAGSIVLALIVFPNHFFLGGIGLAIVTCLAIPSQERQAA